MNSSNSLVFKDALLMLHSVPTFAAAPNLLSAATCVVAGPASTCSCTVDSVDSVDVSLWAFSRWTTNYITV